MSRRSRCRTTGRPHQASRRRGNGIPRLAVGSAVLAVRRAEAELFAMFTDADVIEAVLRRY
ncbi:hypothetical protein [Streptomyces chartreusis]